MNIKKIINNSSFFEKVAVVLFGATTNQGFEFNDAPSERVPVVLTPGGITGVREGFRPGRNLHIVYKKDNGQVLLKKANINLTNTLNKARTNADVQPLFKDDSAIEAPTDQSKILEFKGKNSALSHLVDRRIKQHTTT